MLVLPLLAACVLFAAAAAAQPEIIYYKFNEGSGATTANLAFPGQGWGNGQFSGPPAWITPGHRGNSHIDNSGLERRLSTGYSMSERNGQPFTIELWFRTTGPGFHDLFNDGDSFGIYLDGGTMVCLVGRNGVGTQQGITVGGGFNDGQWRYVALTHNGGTQYVLHRGELTGGLTTTTFTRTATRSDRALELLHWQGLDTYDGEMDEFRIWSVQRTAAQLNANRNAELSPVSMTVYDEDGTYIRPGSTTHLVRVDSTTFTDYNFTLYNNRPANNIRVNPPIQISGVSGATVTVITQPPGGIVNLGGSQDFTIRVTPTATEFTYTASIAYEHVGGGPPQTQPPYVFTVNGIADTGRPEMLYYRFNEAAGTTTANNALPGRGAAAATFTSTPAWNTTDPVLRAASAGNTGTANAATGFAGTDLPLAGFTVEFWMRSTATAGAQVMVGNGTNFAVYLSAGNLAVLGGSQNAFFPGPTVNNGNWHHVAVVSDPGNYGLRVYVNGTQAGEIENFSFPFSSDQLRLFAYGTGNFFNGELDEFRLWAYPRSAAEIAAERNYELFGRLDLQRPAGTSLLPGATDNVGTLNAGVPAPFGYTLLNMGGRDLNLGTVSAGALVNCTVNITPPAVALLAAGDTTLAGVEITPTAAGPFSFTLTVASDDIDVPAYSITVTGNALGAPGILDTATPVAYGASNPGVASSLSPVTHTINNVGGGPLTITAINVIGPDAADWAVAPVAFPVVVSPGVPFNFQATLTPSSVGLLAAQLEIISDTGGAPGTPFFVDVTGEGTAGTLVSPDPTPVNYGSSNVGQLSSGSPFMHTFTNNGNGPLTITAVAMVGAHAGDWGLTAPSLPVVLAPTQSMNVTGNFIPGGVGARTAAVRITSDNGGFAGEQDDFPVTGEGTQGLIDVALGPIDYGTSNVGSPSSNSPVNHTITNTGSGPLTITALSIGGTHASDWGFAGIPSLPHVLAPTQQLILTGTLTPSAVGTRNASIDIVSDTGANPGTPTTVLLTGEGTQGLIDVNLGPIDYGTSNVGSPSSSSPVNHTITNTGSGPLTITALSIGGTHAADWGFAGIPSLPHVLAPTQQLILTGTLTPSATGTRSASIDIVSDTAATPGTPTTVLLTGEGTQGLIDVNLGPIDYGTSNVGSPSSNSPVNHTITNTGSGPLTITALSIGGAHASDWGFAGIPTLPHVLAPTQQLVLTGTLTPSATGTRNASIDIVSDTGANPGTPTTVLLAGEGTQGLIDVALGPIDYGTSNVGSASSNSPVNHTITNTGSGPLTITALSIGGAHAADWGFTGIPSLPHVLAPTQQLVLTGTLTPSAVGTRNASIDIVSDTGANPGTPTTVLLTGEGTQGLIDVALGPIDYGNSNVGSPSSNSPVNHTITNTGSGPLTITALSIGGAHAADWGFAGIPALPHVLAPTQQLVLTGTLTPSAVGTRNASIDIVSDTGANPGTPTTVLLTGEGTQGLIDVNLGPIDYGTSNVGSASSNSPVNHTITNTGSGPLTITALSIGGTHASDWGFAGIPSLPHVLAPTQQFVLTGTLTPSAVGTRNASIDIVSDTGAAPGTPTTVLLTGEGTQGLIDVALGPIDYGNSNVGSPSSNSPVNHTITNTGSGPLTITALSIGGAHAADWGFAGIPPLPHVLAPTQQLVLTGTLTPSAVGTRNASIDIVSDTGANPGTPTTVLLTGEGTQGLIDVALGPIDYGASNVGAASSNSPVNHTITNTGSGPLTITALSVGGAHAADWGFAGIPSLPHVLAPTQQLILTGTLTPSATGTRNASIDIVSDTAATPGTPTTVLLTGEGTQGLIDVNLGPIDYGTSNVGSPSSNSPVNHTITNTGSGPLTITALSIGGAHASDWGFAGIPSLPHVLAPTQQLVLTGTLTPSAVGTRNASIDIVSDTGAAPGTPTTVLLTGEGTQGLIDLNLGPIDYGTSNVGAASSNSPVNHTITNTGTGPLTITALSVGGAHASDWGFAGIPSLPHVLAPTQQLILTGTLTPSVTGTRNASIDIVSDTAATPGTPTTVLIFGEGTQGLIDVALGPIDYGTSNVGSPSSNSPVNHTITNTGSGPLTITALSIGGTHASDWGFAGIPSLPHVLAPTQQLVLTGTLTPSAVGTRNASINIISDTAATPGTPTTVLLTGEGLPATTVSGISVGADNGGPVRVEATVNGPVGSFIDVEVAYTGGINPGPALIHAEGYNVTGNVITDIPAGSAFVFYWDAYATERHTTASYTLTLAPSQGGVPGTPAASAPFTLQREGGWAQHVTPEARARPLFSHSMIYDEANDRLVVFGGRFELPKQSTVWVYERNPTYGEGWRILVPAGTAPLERQYHHAIYDALNGRMIMFGGLSDFGNLNDVWELDLTRGSETWTELTPAGTPPDTRRLGTFVYDEARERAVMFGGLGAVYYNDLWELDLTPGSEAWAELTPGGTLPEERQGAAAVLDPVNDRVVFFGGRTATSATNDEVFELDLSTLTWQSLSASGTPQGRFNATVTLDGTGNRMIVQSGFHNSSILTDMWALDLTGAPNWTQLPPDNDAGAGRVYGGAVWDGTRDEVLFFGGMGAGNRPNGSLTILDVSGTPVFKPSPTAPADAAGPEPRWGPLMAHTNDQRVIVWGGKEHVEYFTGAWVLDRNLPEPAWSRLNPTGTGPSARVYPAWTYDNFGNRLFVYGGLNSTGSLDDLWMLDLNTNAWTQLTGGATPRFWTTLVYDSLRDRLLLHGGRAPGYSADVWEYDIATATWAEIIPQAGPAPVARWGHGASYDAINDRLVIYAGRSATAYMNDVWALSLNPGTEAWSNISAMFGVPPAGRFNFGAAADPTGQRIFVHGGDVGGVNGDLWELNISTAFTTWTAVPYLGSAPLARQHHRAAISAMGDLFVGFGHLNNGPVADLWRIDVNNSFAGWSAAVTRDEPPALVAAATAYDPVNRRMLAFGGLNAGVHDDTLWALDLTLAVAQWTRIDPASPRPSARRGATMVYDPVNNRMVMYGGRLTMSNASNVDEVWALSLTPGSESWTQLFTSYTDYPGARANHSAVVDGANRMIVFGGQTPAQTNSNEVFALDLSTLNWVAITPAGTPPSGRFGVSMVYDAPRDRVVIYGGTPGGANPQPDGFVLELGGSPAWSPLSLAGDDPGGLYYHSAVIDPATDRMIVFGGFTQLAQGRLYALQLGADTWTELTPPVAQPQPRWAHSAAWDVDRMVIAGGYLDGEVSATQGNGDNAQTWFWGD